MLTDAQRKAPHRPANREYDTYLERSFKEARSEEVDEWWALGVVASVFLGDPARGAAGKAGVRQPVDQARVNALWTSLGEGLGRGLDPSVWLPRFAALHAQSQDLPRALDTHAWPHARPLRHPLASATPHLVKQWRAVVQAVDLGLLSPWEPYAAGDRFRGPQSLWSVAFQALHEELPYRQRHDPTAQARQAQHQQDLFQDLKRWWDVTAMTPEQHQAQLNQVARALSYSATPEQRPTLVEWRLALMATGANPWAEQGAFSHWMHSCEALDRRDGPLALEALKEEGLAMAQVLGRAHPVPAMSVSHWLALEKLPSAVRDAIIPALLAQGCSPWVTQEMHHPDAHGGLRGYGNAYQQPLLASLLDMDRSPARDDDQEKTRVDARRAERWARWTTWLTAHAEQWGAAPVAWQEALVRQMHERWPRSASAHRPNISPNQVWQTVSQLGQWRHRGLPSVLRDEWHQQEWSVLRPILTQAIEQGWAAAAMAWSPTQTPSPTVRLWRGLVQEALREPEAACTLEQLLTQCDAEPGLTGVHGRAMVLWTEALVPSNPPLNASQWEQMLSWAKAHAADWTVRAAEASASPSKAPRWAAEPQSPLTVALRHVHLPMVQRLSAQPGVVSPQPYAQGHQSDPIGATEFSPARLQWEAWWTGQEAREQASSFNTEDPTVMLDTLQVLLAHGADPDWGVRTLAQRGSHSTVALACAQALMAHGARVEVLGQWLPAQPADSPLRRWHNTCHTAQALEASLASEAPAAAPRRPRL